MDSHNVAIFLPKSSFFMDFSCKEKLEDNFKELLLNLEESYQIEMKGFYQIKVYQDSYYGTIIEIEEEEIPYFDYLDSQIEMNIHIVKNVCILYQVEDILNLDYEILKSSDLFQYENHFYIKLKKEIKYPNYLKLLEQGTVIYGDRTYNILKFGRLFHKSNEKLSFTK